MTPGLPDVERRELGGPLAVLLAACVFTCLGQACVVLSLWFLVRWFTSPGAGDAERALALMACSAVLVALGSYLAHRGEAALASVARVAVARHLTRLPRRVATAQGKPALRRLLTDDVDALHHLLAHLPSELAAFVVVPSLAVVLLVHTCGPLALVALTPGFAAAIYQLVILPRHMAAHGARGVELMTSVVDAVDDYTRAAQVSRTFTSDRDAQARYRRAAEEFTTGMSAWVARAASRAAVTTAMLQATTTYAIACWVGRDWGVRELATLLLFSLAIVTPARRLGHDLDYARAGLEAWRRIRAFLEIEPLAGAGPATGGSCEALEIEGARLDAGAAPLLVDGVASFSRGSLSVLTGASGTGKTRLLTALAGLDALDAGSVRPALGDDALVVHVPQEAGVLAAGVAENLRLARPSARDGELLAALRRAHLDVDLESAAEHLSGGERHRLALARVFLAEPSIVLLDEPTAGLDAALSAALSRELREFAREGRIVVAVTHDPALIEHADQTSRLHEARLVTEGASR